MTSAVFLSRVAKCRGSDDAGQEVSCLDTAAREFQIMVKTVGAICNLDCHYCYYLEKENLYPKGSNFRLDDKTLEEYIKQHIQATPGEVVSFSWHGGEPTLLGVEFFRKAVDF